MAGGELEGVVGAGEAALAADAAAQELKPGRPRAGGACANCGATLAGAHCHVCGQLADDLHRPVLTLVKEALEGLFSLDGRLLRTVPPLLLRPGRVTAAYLSGRRASYVQPFRLYLLSALVFLLAASIAAGGLSDVELEGDPRQEQIQEAIRELDNLEEELSAELGPAAAAGVAAARAELEGMQASDREELEAAIRQLGELEAELRASAGDAAAVDAADARAELEAARLDDAEVDAATRADEEELARIQRRREMKCEFRVALLPEEPRSECAGVEAENVGVDEAQVQSWPIGLRRRIVRQAEIIIDDPRRFLEAMNRWLPRVLISLFPVYALLLAIMHFWKRRFFFYDHIVVSLHFHSFLFLLLTVLIVASAVAPVWALCLLFLVWSNYGLYKTHRLVYGSGRFTSTLRVLLLDFLYMIILLFVPVVLAIGGFLTA